MRYHVESGSLLRNAVIIRFSATIFSISALACCSTENQTTCVVFAVDGAWKEAIVPDTKSDFTSPLGSIVSLIDVIPILNFKLSSIYKLVSSTMINNFRKGW